ncbi:HNH endonuclease [Laceyella sacchari]
MESGEYPVRYTWNHRQNKGKMQLVQSKIHGLLRHTDGRPTWGGHVR